MRRMSRVVLLVVLGILAASCSSEGDSQRVADLLGSTTLPDDGGTDGSDDGGTTVPPPTTTPEGAAAWTVLVYGMGDNDLEPFLLEDLAEMAAVGSTEELNIIALVDRSADYSSEPVLNLPDFEDTRLLRVEQGELVDLTSEPTEVSTGDPDTLASFIEVGVTNFPAARYALVLWDHGGGWIGMGPDETDGFNGLDLAEIEQGIADGLARSGLDRLDVVGFDACLMATYEVASVMSRYADHLLASAELEPGHGWNWEGLDVLAQDPSATPADLGARIVETYAQQAQAAGTEAEITLSLLDLTSLSALEDALGELTADLSAEIQAVAAGLAQARNQTLAYGYSPDPEQNTNLVDLGLLLDNIAAAGRDTSDARSALDSMVLANVDGIATAGSSGMSIYFPPNAGEYRAGYDLLSSVEHWPDLLMALFEAGAAIPEEQQPTFVNTEGQAEYFFDQDGLNIFGTFDLAAQDNLVEATIFYGILDENDGSIIYLGEEPGEVATDGSGLAGAIFDLTVLTLSDGIDTAYAYLVLNFDESTGYAIIDIPLHYQAPSDFGTDFYQDLILSVIVDPEDASVLSEVYYAYDSNTGAYGEAFVEPDGLIYPVVLNEYPDGSVEWIHTLGVGLYADLPAIQYSFERLPEGTGLYAELAVFDYAGNTDSVSMFDFVPAP